MFCKVILVGHLGRDPEMRYTPSGVPVTSFNVATTRSWTNTAGEKQEKTTWTRVTCWRKLAELAAQYLRKGRLVLVEGAQIEASAFTDREGNARASLELTADTIKFLGRNDTASANNTGDEPADVPEIEGEDIPF